MVQTTSLRNPQHSSFFCDLFGSCILVLVIYKKAASYSKQLFYLLLNILVTKPSEPFLLLRLLHRVIALGLTGSWCVHSLFEDRKLGRRRHRLPGIIALVDIGSFAVRIQADRFHFLALNKCLYYLVFIHPPYLRRNAVYFLGSVLKRPLDDDRHHETALVAEDELVRVTIPIIGLFAIVQGIGSSGGNPYVVLIGVVLLDAT